MGKMILCQRSRKSLGNDLTPALDNNLTSVNKHWPSHGAKYHSAIGVWHLKGSVSESV